MAKKDGTADLRVKRTQKAIKIALLQLIETKGFEKITVKDITDEAEISRNTFYLHFEDKYDLTNKTCEELIRKLFFGIGKQLRREQKLDFDIRSAARIMQIGLKIIDENRDDYRILLSCSGTDLLEQKLSEVIRNALGMIQKEMEGLSDYSVEYIVNGVCGLVKHHVNNNVENVDDVCLKFVKLHLGTIIDTIVQNRKNARR